MGEGKEALPSLVKKVKSSNIAGIGYDSRTKILYVQFIGGGMYSYHPFSKSKYYTFIEAKSKGEWFHKHIRTNRKYTIQKINL
jgi:hypothetical protein